MTRFHDLPRIAQVALRELFERKTAQSFDELIREHIDYFLAEPDIVDRWRLYQRDMIQCELDHGWTSWLADHDITEMGEPT